MNLYYIIRFNVTIPYFTGIILVHDLTNRKSQENLQKWLTEVLSKESYSKVKKNEEYDVEQFVGYSQVTNLKDRRKFVAKFPSRSTRLSLHLLLFRFRYS